MNPAVLLRWFALVCEPLGQPVPVPFTIVELPIMRLFGSPSRIVFLLAVPPEALATAGFVFPTLA